jgi:hypothetical protein
LFGKGTIRRELRFQRFAECFHLIRFQQLKRRLILPLEARELQK